VHRRLVLHTNQTLEGIVRILHLDSSIAGPNSVSRTLSAELVATYSAHHRGAEVTYHDLASDPVMHLSPAHLAAFMGGKVESPALEKDLAQGARYIDELFAADVIVIGTPMYNHGIPSQLKAWIDRVVVARKTFQYTAHGPEGLLPPGKKVFIAASSGGVYSGDSPAKDFEHSVSYLNGVLGLVGLKDVSVIRAEGVNTSPEARQGAIEKARHAIDAIFATKMAA
jgi:FMN-dependent NADH-azoreductase